MAVENRAAKKRTPRAQRGPRDDTGRKIIFRVTDEEAQRLREAAWGMSLSQYVRLRVLGGQVSAHADLQKVAALHNIGIALMKLASMAQPDPNIIRALLARTSSAIDAIAADLAKPGEPEASDQ